MCTSSSFSLPRHPNQQGPNQQSPMALDDYNAQSNVKIAAVYEKTRMLDDTIRQLYLDRAKLQWELNTLQSLTRALPQEILAEIFEHTYPPIDFTARSPRHTYHEEHLDDPVETLFVFRLAAVSSYWRQVAFSTPRLWTTLSLDIRRGNENTIANNVAVLRSYLSNASPLSLSLEINRDPISVSDEALYGMKELVLRNASRIRLLRLSAPPASWPLSIIDHGSSFTILEDLRLGWPSFDQYRPPQEEIPLGTISSLSRLSLKYVSPRISVHWRSITAVNLYGIPINTCVELLVCCPNLTEYRSHLTTDELVPLDPWTPWLENSLITLYHLKVLEWTCHPSPWCDALLARLHLPSIHTLTFSGCQGYIPQPSFWSFTGRLPSDLRMLELARRPASYDMLRQLFGYMIQLERLVVRDCGRETFFDIFRALSPQEEEDSKMVTWLPSLRDLRIIYKYGCDATMSQKTPDLVTDLMKQRQEKGNADLCLKVVLD